jgi:hypothetical protein
MLCLRPRHFGVRRSDDGDAIGDDLVQAELLPGEVDLEVPSRQLAAFIIRPGEGGVVQSDSAFTGTTLVVSTSRPLSLPVSHQRPRCWPP